MTSKTVLLVCCAGLLFLSACNYPSAAASPTPIIILPEVATQIVATIMASNPSPSAPAATFTPTPNETPAPPTSTPTLTLFYNPTITSTPSWLACPLVIEVNDTRKGDFLKIRRCEDNLEYEIGPFAKGVYAASPDMRVIVYVTNDGMAYAFKIGERQLHLLANLQRERFFTVLGTGAPTRFSISFIGEAPAYQVVISEAKFKQKKIYSLPARVLE